MTFSREGFTRVRRPTTTVGTVSLPRAARRTAAAASSSFQMLRSFSVIPAATSSTLRFLQNRQCGRHRNSTFGAWFIPLRPSRVISIGVTRINRLRPTTPPVQRYDPQHRENLAHFSAHAPGTASFQCVVTGNNPMGCADTHDQRPHSRNVPPEHGKDQPQAMYGYGFSTFRQTS